jgi:hypothetical protein
MLNDSFNIDPSSGIESKAERDILSFEDYFSICNYNNDSSRLRGVLFGEVYNKVIKDQSTIFIELSGKKVPVFIDIKYGLGTGYVPEKCQEYAKDLSENIKILALPIHELGDEEKNQVGEILKSSDFAFYFADHNEDESSNIKEILDKISVNYIEKPLIDSRTLPGDEQAALSLYECNTRQKNPENSKNITKLTEAYDFYINELEPHVSADGSFSVDLRRGNNLDEKQIDELWGLLTDRFAILTDIHPISMEDTKDDFISLIKSDSVIISSAYKQIGDEKKLSCFTYFVDDISRLYWLNNDFIFKKTNKNNLVLFTPGIVSSAEGQSLSSHVISLFSKACMGVGANVDILYENTNLSKKYIPRIVDRAISRSYDGMDYINSKEIDRIKYRLFKVN